MIRPRLFSILALAAASLAACASHQHESHATAHWGYESPVGPANWCDLDPANSDCCKGGEQSPIDLSASKAAHDSVPKLEFEYPPSTFSVANNGHTVQATLEIDKARCGLKLGGLPYDLVQFHVHAPSEHTLEGKHSPLELHFVHKSADGELAVVGIFVASGSANSELEKIWRLAPATEGNGGVAAGVNVSNVLPESRVDFRYPGSLTTPPCTEHVKWIVMQTPIAMSEAQIAKITAMFSGPEFPEGNCRPVQPLGNRKVEIDPGQ